MYLSSEPLLNCSASSNARKKEVEWTFFYPTSSETTNSLQNTHSSDRESTNFSSFPRPRQVLIALTSGYDQHATMLTHTAHAALLYASRQNLLRQERQHHEQQGSSNTTSTNLNVTVVVLQGMAFHPHDEVACTIPPTYASLNKIRLLFYAIDHSMEYDYLLLLDADALLVDWDYDFTQLLREHDDSHLLAAQPCRGTNVRPVRNDDDPSSHDDGQQQQQQLEQATRINSGTTFWNLHHDQIKPVAISWFQESKNAALQGVYQGDQRYLQMALSLAVLDNDTTTATSLVRPTLQEFNYRDGSVVQHFMQRGKIDTWKDRLDQLVNIYEQHLCKKYDCSQVPRKEFLTQ